MDVWKLFTLSVMSSNKEEYYFITSTLAVPYRLTVATSNPTLPSALIGYMRAVAPSAGFW